MSLRCSIKNLDALQTERMILIGRRTVGQFRGSGPVPSQTQLLKKQQECMILIGQRTMGQSGGSGPVPSETQLYKKQ